MGIQNYKALNTINLHVVQLKVDSASVICHVEVVCLWKRGKLNETQIDQVDKPLQ